MTAMILGCIDIGSNTTRLLVADARLRPPREVAADKVFTHIGASVDGTGAIPGEKIAQVAQVVRAQAALARDAGTERLVTVATAVVRHAPNAAALAAAVKRDAGLELRVLSGEEEARLSFLGATRALAEPVSAPLAVIDVGGGSTEIAVGASDQAVVWSRSLRIGSGLLADAHLRADPPTTGELGRVREQVEATFEGLRPPRVASAFAVGGTATSLRRLVGSELSGDSLRRGVEVLCRAPAAEIVAGFELDLERVRLLPAGIMVLAAICERLSCPMRVAQGGLREGLVAELAGT